MAEAERREIMRAAAVEAIRLGDLADLLHGEVQGNPDTVITSAAGVDDASAGSIVRAENPRYAAAAERSPAAAILIDRQCGAMTKPAIKVDQIRFAWIRCLELFAPEDAAPPGVHATAVVGDACEIGAGCSV